MFLDRNGRVKQLNLAFNGLSGTVPKEIGLALTDLKSLYLYANELHGQLQPSIFALKKLKYLHLQANNFEGSIPTDVSNMKELRELYIYGNNLSGNLPTSIQNLRKLEVIDVYNNNFNGKINPSLFKNMKSLNELYLNDNDFTGKIGSNSVLCQRKLIEFSSDCRGGIHAEVTCDCCTTCCHDKAEPKCIEMQKVATTKKKKR